jgi:autotransporter-associated beta strand protein/predicted outer membrane repeat protein
VVFRHVKRAENPHNVRIHPMKTSAFPGSTRLATAASIALAFAFALAFFHAPAIRAGEHAFATGSSVATTVAALADGDSVAISGSTGVVTLSNGVSLAVSAWAQANAQFTLGARTGITFAPAAGDGWAVLQTVATGASGRIFNLTVNPGGSTLNLDRVILAGATEAPALATASSTALLTIGGPVVFYNNINTVGGGGIRSYSGIEFLDAVVFDQNLGGYTIGTGAWAATSNGGGVVMMTADAPATFKGDALFASNTAGLSGAGFYRPAGATGVFFEQSATFSGNYAGAGGAATASGGGLYFNGPAAPATGTLAFLGDVTFDANSALIGGGLRTAGAGTVLVFGGNATFTDNIARTGAGGALYLDGATRYVITPGAGKTVLISGNTAATTGGGIHTSGGSSILEIAAEKIIISRNTVTAANSYGGGIRAANQVTVTGAFDFSGNTAAFGGAIAARTINIMGAGTFAGNTAGQSGGAIHVTNFANTNAIQLSLTATGGDIVFTGNTAAGAPGSAGVFFNADMNASLALDAAAGCSILFYDPIYYGSGKVLTVTKDGDGAVLFDRHEQDADATTTVNAGVFALANNATWSRVTTGNTFRLNASGTLAGDGVVASGAMILAAGSHVQAWNGGTLALNATTRTFGNALSLSGDGLINAGAALDAALVTAGTSHGMGATPAVLALAGPLTLAAGGTLRFDLFDGASSDLLETRGGIALAGGATIDLGLLATGSFTLVSWAGATGLADTSGLALTLNGDSLTARTVAMLGVDTTAQTLHVTNTTFGLSLEWTGADAVSGTAFWAGNPAAHANFIDLTTGPDAGTETHFRDGDSVLFANPAAATVHVDATGVTASELTIDNTAPLTFAGPGAITIDDASAPGHFRAATTGTTGRLIKNGAAAVTIANTATNTFRGGIDVNTGLLTLANPANKIPGGVTLAGGTLAISTAAQLDTAGGAVFFQNGGHLLISQAIAGGAALTNTLHFAAAATGVLDISTTGTGAVAFAGALDGSGTLAKTGGGTLRILPAANASAFTGATRLEAGSLLLAPGATLGGSVSIAGGAIGGGAGTLAGDVTVATGGLLQAGGLNGAGATLTIGGNLALAGSATMQFNIYPAANDRLSLSSGTGALAAAASSIVNIVGDIQSGTYLLGNAVKLADAGAILKINGNALNPTLRFTGALGKTSDGGTLTFHYGADSSRYMLWNIAASGTWDVLLDNWADYDGGVSAPLAGKTKFQNRDTVRLATATDATITLAGDVTLSDLLVENTGGTLTLAGAAITTGSAINDNLIAAPSAKLTKTGDGTLLLANTANLFAGGIDLREGMLAFSTAAQLRTEGAGINFTGGGTLRALAPLTLPDTLALTGGITATLDTGGNTVTLAGELSGDGTLAKTGDGTLVYQSLALAPATGAAGNLATRIDSGVLQLRDIAAPATFAHTVILNGGWLDLSDPAAATFTGASPLADSANDWSALTLLSTAGGTAGGVIGANDVVTLGASEINFAIGGSTSVENGLYVRIAAGAGATTFTRENTYAGRTIIDSGVLAITADNQLGEATLARDIILNGGTLAINAGLASARRLELTGGGGGILLAENVAASLAGSVGDAPAAALEIAGAGALALTAPLAHAGETAVTGGILRAPGEFLPGAVRLAEAAVLEITQQTDGIFTGTLAISGNGGVITKSGSATLALNPGSIITAREIHVESGALALTPAAGLSASALFRIAPGARLRGAGAIALAPGARLLNHGEIRVGHAGGAAAHGTLVIAGDYEGSGVLHLAVGPIAAGGVQADKFTVTGSAAGNTLVRFHQDSAQPALPAGYSLPDDIITIAIAAPGAFMQDGPGLIYGGTEYNWRQISATGGIWLSGIATEVDAATGADAAALLAGKAAANALANRLSALRFTPRTTGVAVWADAFHRHDKLRGSIYNKAASSLHGIQAGADYRIGSDVRSPGAAIPTLTAGIFTDCASSDFDQPGAGRAAAGAENHAFGAYLMLQQGRWHVGMLTRASEETYRVSPVAAPVFRIKGNGTLQKISVGLDIHKFREWHLESQVSLARQRVKLDTTASPAGITYSFDATESLEAAAPLQLWQDFKWKNDLRIRPGLGVAFLYDSKGRSAFTANGQPFATDLGGAACQVDAACVIQLSRRLEAAAACSCLFGSTIESYSLTLGLSHRW